MTAVNKKIRAVFFDLDGSTLEQDLSLTSSFMAVVNRHRDRKWIITTGRGMWSVCDLGLHEVVDSGTPHIFDSGAQICQLNGVSVLKRLLSEREKGDTLSYLSTLRCIDHIYASVFPEAGFVWPSTGKASAKYGRLVGFDQYETFVNAVMEVEVTKISVKCRQDLEFPPRLNVVRQGYSHDILGLGSSKGNAINTVRELLGLCPEEIAFVFDDQNDLSAIECVALSGMYMIKVGSKLPSIRADIDVGGVREVAQHIEGILA